MQTAKYFERTRKFAGYASKVASKVNKHSVSTVQAQCNSELITALKNTSRLIVKRNACIQKFTDYYDTWCEKRKVVIEEIKRLANELHSLQKGENVKNVATGSIGAAGGLATVAGIVAAPFTFGASLLLTVGGTVAAAASGIASATGTVVITTKIKHRSEEAQTLLNEDTECTKELYKYIEEICDISAELERTADDLTKWNPAEILAVGSAGVAGTAVAVQAVAVSMAGFKIATKLGSSGGELGVMTGRLAKTFFFKGATIGTRLAGAAFAALGVGFDIYTIVSSSKDLSKGSHSEASTLLYDAAKSLEKERDDIVDFRNDIIESLDDQKCSASDSSECSDDSSSTEDSDSGDSSNTDGHCDTCTSNCCDKIGHCNNCDTRNHCDGENYADTNDLHETQNNCDTSNATYS